MAVAVADFDYIDPTGGVMEQERVATERLRTLVQQVRDGLDQSDRYRVVLLECAARAVLGRPHRPRRADRQGQAAGARLLVFGGIQKMNAAIQDGNAEVVDLEADRLCSTATSPSERQRTKPVNHAAKFLVAELMKENLVR